MPCANAPIFADLRSPPTTLPMADELTQAGAAMTEAKDTAAAAKPNGRRTPFTDAELDDFKALIYEKRAQAMEEIDAMKAQIEDSRESETDSAYSFHMADAGTDAMEREKLYLMIARQQKYVGYLDRALERIENKSYGLCKVTGKPIPKERLMAVPHTEISIEAKMAQKK